jgi:hypothetical protein
MRMIYHADSADQYVYHYTRGDVARDFILKDRTLRLGRLLHTNDPRETKDWEFDLWTSGAHDLGKYKMPEISNWMSNALKANVRLACFSRDTPPVQGDHVAEILRRGFTKPRMWAQYANNHSGVCLVFDRQKLLESMIMNLQGNTCWAGNVTYKDHFTVRSLTPHEFMVNVDELEVVGPDAYAMNHLVRHHDELFFEKLQDWRDESEWRLLAVGPGIEPLFLDISEALVGVMHGASADDKLSDQIMKLTEHLPIEHMGLKWKNSNPWYDLANFKWSHIDRHSPWYRAKSGA